MLKLLAVAATVAIATVAVAIRRPTRDRDRECTRESECDGEAEIPHARTLDHVTVRCLRNVLRKSSPVRSLHNFSFGPERLPHRDREQDA